jgi:glycosyltransferase involved in cell wall biosynthesis
MSLKVCQLCAVDFTLVYFLLPLIDGMREVGWEVVSVCSDGPEVAGIRQRGYRIETVPIARSYNLFAHLVTFFKLVRLFRRERFDIVHVHTPVAALVGRFAAWVSKTPMIIYTAHGFYFHEEMPFLQRRIFVFLERIAGHFTDLLFTQSEEDKQVALAEHIATLNQVTAIGNGVDVGRFDPEAMGDQHGLRQQLGISQNSYVVGMIGRQVREKGIVEFLEAAQKIAPTHPHVIFLLVGDRLTTDHAALVSDEIEQAKTVLGKRLILTGRRDDIPELLAVMDLFCLPSWREGMPRTIIEAMMMSKPVVATDIRGAREEVINEETGLLVPTRRPLLLAQAILRCIAQPEWAKGLGANGRERALMLYDESRIVATQIEKICECLQKKTYELR